MLITWHYAFLSYPYDVLAFYAMPQVHYTHNIIDYYGIQLLSLDARMFSKQTIPIRSRKRACRNMETECKTQQHNYNIY